MQILVLSRVSKIDSHVLCTEGCRETDAASPYLLIFYSFLGGSLQRKTRVEKPRLASGSGSVIVEPTMFCSLTFKKVLCNFQVVMKYHSAY